MAGAVSHHHISSTNGAAVSRSAGLADRRPTPHRLNLEARIPTHGVLARPGHEQALRQAAESPSAHQGGVDGQESGHIVVLERTGSQGQGLHLGQFVRLGDLGAGASDQHAPLPPALGVVVVDFEGDHGPRHGRVELGPVDGPHDDPVVEQAEVHREDGWERLDTDAQPPDLPGGQQRQAFLPGQCLQTLPGERIHHEDAGWESEPTPARVEGRKLWGTTVAGSFSRGGGSTISGWPLSGCGRESDGSLDPSVLSAWRSLSSARCGYSGEPSIASSPTRFSKPLPRPTIPLTRSGRRSGSAGRRGRGRYLTENLPIQLPMDSCGTAPAGRRAGLSCRTGWRARTHRPARHAPRTRLARAAGEQLPVRWLLVEWLQGEPEPRARREVEWVSVRDSTTTPIVGVSPAAPTPLSASLPRPLPSRRGGEPHGWLPRASTVGRTVTVAAPPNRVKRRTGFLTLEGTLSAGRHYCCTRKGCAMELSIPASPSRLA